MDYQTWRNDPSLASELKKVLNKPVLKNALAILEGQTMAKTLAGNGLLQLSDKAHVLFGYDAGRASIISDLENLAETPEEITSIQPTYQGEF
jgi:hypothetical protein